MPAAAIATAVPFVDLKRQYAPLRAQFLAAMEGAFDRCDFIMGKAVRQFEEHMARHQGCADVVAVANATSGLFAILKCMGIGPGDEVITTVHTAIATAEAITLTGARVVFCDIDPRTYTIDPEHVRRRITDKTRAIIPVHLYGHAADLDRLLPLAREHDLKVIEDCAQAQGARFHGDRVGNFGDAAAFSFFPSKNLGGFGDGGAVIARDPVLLKRIRMFSNHGREDKYLHEFEGMNSRLDTIKAATLDIALPHLDDWNAQRRQAAAWYQEGLGAVDAVQLPVEREHCEHIYHVYVVKVADREALADDLKKRNIRTGVHYPYALNVLPAFEYMNEGRGHFPVAEDACEHILSLPMFPGITHEEVDAVCAAVREFYA